MIVELINKPKRIAEKVLILGMLNKYAAMQPVHAPVTGNGIPTNRASPKNSYFSINVPRFRVLLNSQFKKDLRNGIRFAILTIGSSMNIIGTVIKKLPKIDIITIYESGKFVKKYPHGIEPLNSPTGSIERKNVVAFGFAVRWFM